MCARRHRAPFVSETQTRGKRGNGEKEALESNSNLFRVLLPEREENHFRARFSSTKNALLSFSLSVF